MRPSINVLWLPELEPPGVSEEVLPDELPGVWEELPPVGLPGVWELLPGAWDQVPDELLPGTEEPGVVLPEGPPVTVVWEEFPPDEEEPPARYTPLALNV